MSSEIVPKENLVYRHKDSLVEYNCLGSALRWYLDPSIYYVEKVKIYTLDQLNHFIKDNIKMYQKDLTELPWDKVRWQPSCACFGCRMKKRVSGWFRGKKCK